MPGSQIFLTEVKLVQRIREDSLTEASTGAHSHSFLDF